MELQLCLSLAPTTIKNNIPIVGIDLNNFFPEGNIYDHVSQNDKFGSNTNKAKIMKRSYFQAFSEIGSNSHQSKTLPLLWSNSPIEDGRDDHEKKNFPSHVNDVDEEAVVEGWPPIKSRRRRLCCEFAGQSDGSRTVENSCSCGERISKFMYVKVKMEGVGIARKVDLSVHNCFETLMNTLLNMFGKFFEDEDYYSLTYQDRKGDWLLAKGVSWRIFIRTVQRLKLVKRNHRMEPLILKLAS